ncbi:MAG: o-succinylbenzoate synthase [Opitutaceae bacterium]|nr:o-succinylbenzoate synthase [Opitutaceae bacterium]
MLYTFAHRTYRLPLNPPLRTAHGRWDWREGIIVRLEDEAGWVGYGEAAPVPGHGTETWAEVDQLCRAFGDRVSAEELARVPGRFGCLRFALALAQARPEPALPIGRLGVAALLPAGRGALPALAARLEAGYLAFKWKVGVAPVEEELGVFDDLLAELPAHARLRLDANGAWNRRQAGRWLDRCAGRPVEFVEQPLVPDDEDGLRGLAGDYPVCLALDESVVRLEEARRWQAQGWPGVFVLKPALAGPLEETARWIESTRADVVLSSALETVLARSAILRWALARQLTRRPLGFGVGGVFGARRWDGPEIGPLADSSCLANDPGKELWTALD